jgi:ubiquinone biosynthesis protein
MTAAAWIILGPLAAALVTFTAGRLLGARRGWASLAVSGLVGFVAAVIAAGALTDWDWPTLNMASLTLAFGTLFTMAMALILDLVAPIGTLHKGEAAGLIEVSKPLSGLRRKVLPLRRYRQVVSLARKNGVVARGVSAESLPGGVRRTLEEAGGIFVKLGQVASTRSDVLPRAWCDELSHLRSSAEPAPEAEMRPHVAAALGRDPAEVFSSFDWTPIASASISQVYRAALADGTPVIVKVQRPGLDRTLELDGAAVMQIARLIERRTPLGLSVRPADLAQEFVESVGEELDFGIEAANGVQLAAALVDVPGVRIPRIYPELSGPLIMTQELIDAPNLGQFIDGGTSADAVDPIALADRLIGVFLRQIFTIGTFHADPHPGNILVEPDGTIVLIDLGAVGRLGAGHREAVLDMLAAASTGNAAGLRQALGQITLFDKRVDQRQLEMTLESFLARHLRSGGGIDASAFEDLTILIGRYGIRLPRWFGTLSRTLVTLEGTLKGLDRSFSLVDAAKRHAKALMPDLAVADPQELLQRELIAELPRLKRLPAQLDELLSQAVTGRLSAQLSVFADERDERLVTRLVDRLVLGMIAAATSIASVLLLGVDIGPEVREVDVNTVLGYFGLAASAVLAFRVVAGIIRDGET